MSNYFPELRSIPEQCLLGNDIISVSMAIMYLLMIVLVFHFTSEKELKISAKNSAYEEVLKVMKEHLSNFHNQYNVIAGYIQLEKYDKAFDYIEKSAKENCKAYSFWLIKDSTVAISLYNKYIMAKNKGICFEVSIDSSLGEINLDSKKLCFILSELLDNAIYELENCHEDTKVLTLDISEGHNEYALTVGNSYPVLSSDLYGEIFKRGYTTKEGNRKGYGLDNVRKIIKKKKGRIVLESYNKRGTIFTVFLPKKKKVANK